MPSINSWNNTITAASAITTSTTNGAITMNSGTGQIDIGSDATAASYNFASGAGNKVAILGSTNGASSLALKYGTADFTLASATGTVITALDSGEVTMPLQPSFLGQLATTALNKTGTGTVYTIGSDALTEIYDQGGDFTTAGVFTAPVTGKYILGAQVTVVGCTIATFLNINLITSNRSVILYQGRAASAANFYNQSCALLDMDSGDTFTSNCLAAGEAGDTDDIFGQVTDLFTGMWGSLQC